MKIALVHDQLQEFGGAERVLIALKDIYPEADVYTSFYNPKQLGFHKYNFNDWTIKTSWVNRLPLIKKIYSPLRFITPLIWESFDFRGYDLVISSSGSYMSKGIITRPETIHICYLHHPPRYLYYYETAIEWQKYLPIKIYGQLINHHLRIWDYLSSQRVDYFIANSQETKKRIEKFYRREATVIYPPVFLPESPPLELPTGDYFITTSRLARAKHIEILIKAANKARFALKVIGSGREEKYLRQIAGPTIEFLNNITDTEFAHIYNQARAFLFASVDEEFGIAPVEAMGYGLPVIAYASGGLKETIKHHINGLLYQQLDENEVIAQIRALDQLSESEYLNMKHQARATAQHYSFHFFKVRIREFISDKIKKVKT